MQNIAVHKVGNLQQTTKETVEGLLGRKLADEEEVAVLAFPPHPAPPEAVCQAAATRLANVMDKAAEKAAHIPDDELQAAIDEALE